MGQLPDTYSTLAASYKGAYPFKLGTTSFIYPDTYVANVKMLGPFVDEIELLLFESTGIESLFSAAVVNELLGLASTFKLAYNVHLPTDISIGDYDLTNQRHAVRTYAAIIQRLLPLGPSSFTLHIPYREYDFARGTVQKWRDRIQSNLDLLLGSGITPESISIETLDYSIDLLADIIDAYNLSICLDVGHLLVRQDDVSELFHRYTARIAVIHVHGVENNRDHLALNRLPPGFIDPMINLLKRFTGFVSIEVFCYRDLTVSLQFLERCWQNSIGTGARMCLTIPPNCTIIP